MKQYSISELESMNVSKGEIFKELTNEGTTFDYALPQNWLDELANYCKKYIPTVTYNMILSTVVWGYGEGDYFGHPITCCKEVERAIQYKKHSLHLIDLQRSRL